MLPQLARMGASVICRTNATNGSNPWARELSENSNLEWGSPSSGSVANIRMWKKKGPNTGKTRAVFQKLSGD